MPGNLRPILLILLTLVCLLLSDSGAGTKDSKLLITCNNLLGA
ncbi:hypothetical protein [Borrelia duttonii]